MRKGVITACILRDLEMVKLLLSKGAKVDYENSKTFTPLLLACLGHHIEVIEVLLDYGADPYKKNKNWLTPYGVANLKERELIEKHGPSKGIRVLQKLGVYNPIAGNYGVDENGTDFDDALAEYMGKGDKKRNKKSKKSKKSKNNKIKSNINLKKSKKRL